MALTSEAKDRDALSLSLDHLAASSSPFPSPSSSFVPPPIPGTHEFAVLSPHALRKKFANARKESDDSKQVHNSNISSQINKSEIAGNGVADLSTMANGTPTTPTPTTMPPQIEQRPQSQPPSLLSHETLLARVEHTPPTSPFTQTFRQSRTLSSRLSRDSLMSNRPAPPSPEPRRVSGAPSTASSRSRRSLKLSNSRPSSTALSRTNSTRISSRLSTQIAIAPSSPAPSTATRRPRSLLVKVRDFAFPPEDERHQGLGPDVPRANRLKVLNRRKTDSSVSSVGSSDGEEDEDDEVEDDGWGGFKWGAFPWTGGKSGNGDGSMPSNVDFARNFGADVGEDENEVGDEDGVEEGDGDQFLLGDEPLYPGLYRALYAFVPESSSEMALEEEQVVRVVGRGGGIGWAVVVKPEELGGGHALVPESYLEVMRLDEEGEVFD